jgi:hypothetical protein
MRGLNALRSTLQRFRRDDSGVVTVEFVLIFPIFFSIFLMTYESGMISLRHVMLERGVDVTVRDIRIGQLVDPSLADLRTSICDVAGIIPDCEAQLQVELLPNDLRNWTTVNGTVQCVDRGDPGSTPDKITNGGNNELMFLRACARIDPILPSSAIGKNKISLSAAIEASGTSTAAAGSYALVSTAAFVIEPFR